MNNSLMLQKNPRYKNINSSSGFRFDLKTLKNVSHMPLARV